MLRHTWIALLTGLALLGCAEGNSAASCTDGKDNDGDGKTDCQDPDCDSYCSEEPEGDCSIGDCDGDGWTVDDGDCDDEDYDVNPDQDEACDGVDNDCDGDVDEDFDLDADGFPDGANDECANALPADQLDCNDADVTVYPGAFEECGDGIDNDCDGLVDENMDEDGDGITNCDGDCDDSDPTVHPGATEECNDVDDNCDGDVDEGLPTYPYYVDGDGDGYGDADATPVEDCGPPDGHADNAEDCDDTDASVNPGADEDPCDGVDNDCSAATSDTPDHDGDGFSICDECDDSDASVNPDADEVLCDGVDNDCDAGTPDAPDADNDGIDACSGDCDDDDAGVGTGTWVPHDVATIQAAIAAASNGDDVCVDAGTYTGFVDFLGKDVHLIGVFGPDQTTLEAPGPGSVVTFSGGESAAAVLQGLTITGGTAMFGGGIRVLNASPTLTELVVTGNVANDSGGGISAECTSGAMAPEFSRMVVSDNITSGSGGGIDLWSDGASCTLNARLENVIIRDNSSGSSGGGLLWYLSDGGGSLEMSHCLVAGNHAGYYAGGITAGSNDDPATATLDHVVIANNQADQWAGGVYFTGPSNAFAATMSHCAVLRNDAMRAGGGIHNYWNAHLELFDVVVTENTANEYGGGVNTEYGGVLVDAHNCDVWGNAPNDWAGSQDYTGTNGNISMDPGYLSLSGADATAWDLHLSTTSPLVNAGSDTDPDGSNADMGVYGGPDADGWDLDWDGYFEWWKPGAYDAATSPGMDCDDRDEQVYPGQGC